MTVTRFEEKTYNTDSLDVQLWKRILGLLKNQRHHLVKIACLNIVIAMFDVLLPYMNKIAIDTFATGKGNNTQLMIFTIVFLCGVLIQAGLVYLYFLQAGRMESETAHELRKNLFHQLQSLSYSFFDVTPAGWLLSRITSDVSRLAEILSWSLMDCAWGMSTMIGADVLYP